MSMHSEGLIGTRKYNKPVSAILNAINDLVELQKGDVTYDDISQGKIFFQVEMYGFTWEYQFTVREMPKDKSVVALEIGGDPTNIESRIIRQFALLDSMFVDSGGVVIANLSHYPLNTKS